MTTFDQAFLIVVSEEGNFDLSPADSGNWTGGTVGVGQLLGTKYGIDTASYPDVLKLVPPDIRATMPATVADLTLDQAKTLYLSGYWHPAHCDDLPPALALLVFDAAVNNGNSEAIKLLQVALDVEPVSGYFGSITTAALRASLANPGLIPLCGEYQAQRIAYMSGLPKWSEYGRNATTGRAAGWSRRLTALCFEAAKLSERGLPGGV